MSRRRRLIRHTTDDILRTQPTQLALAVGLPRAAQAVEIARRLLLRVHDSTQFRFHAIFASLLHCRCSFHCCNGHCFMKRRGFRLSDIATPLMARYRLILAKKI